REAVFQLRSGELALPAAAGRCLYRPDSRPARAGAGVGGDAVASAKLTLLGSDLIQRTVRCSRSWRSDQPAVRMSSPGGLGWRAAAGAALPSLDRTDRSRAARRPGKYRSGLHLHFESTGSSPAWLERAA